MIFHVLNEIFSISHSDIFAKNALVGGIFHVSFGMPNNSSEIAKFVVQFVLSAQFTFIHVLLLPWIMFASVVVQCLTGVKKVQADDTDEVTETFWRKFRLDDFFRMQEFMRNQVSSASESLVAVLAGELRCFLVDFEIGRFIWIVDYHVTKNLKQELVLLRQKMIIKILILYLSLANETLQTYFTMELLSGIFVRLFMNSHVAR